MVKQESINLSKIYQKIEKINEYPMVEAQLNAVKQWHKFMMKYYEYDVLSWSAHHHVSLKQSQTMLFVKWRFTKDMIYISKRLLQP